MARRIEGDYVIYETGTKSLRCRAKCKKNLDGRCNRVALKGKTLCGNHGGVQEGEVPHNLKRLRSARQYLPTRLAESFDEHMKDETLISLQRDLASVEALIDEVSKEMSAEYCGNEKLWSRAKELYDAYVETEDGGILHSLGQVLETANQVAVLEEKFLKLTEQRRKLAETEHRRIKDAHDSITKKDAILLMTVLVTVVNKHVPDLKARASIAREIDRIALKTDGSGDLAETNLN